MAKWQTECIGMTGATIEAMNADMIAVATAIAAASQQILGVADLAAWAAAKTAIQTLMNNLGADAGSKWRMSIASDTGKYFQITVEKQS